MVWFCDHATLISLLNGAAQLVVALVLVIGARRRVGRIPLLAWLLGAYFVVNACMSLARSMLDTDVHQAVSWIVALELLGVVLLVLLLARASQIARALAFVIDEARVRAAEYARARHDYTQVVRHRIANPLAVIRGAAQTLERGSLDDITRHELRQAIIEASELLESISLAPERAGVEERELDAVAHVDTDADDAHRPYTA